MPPRPSTGNVLELSNGKLGLIDYGQTVRLDQIDRRKIALIISLIGSNDYLDVERVTEAMLDLGFRTRDGRGDVMVAYAKMLFDSDLEARKQGFTNSQLYLLKLTSTDPLVAVPDSAGAFTA